MYGHVGIAEQQNALGDASIVRRSSQRVELVEVGMVGEFHCEVRVHSCDYVMIVATAVETHRGAS